MCTITQPRAPSYPDLATFIRSTRNNLTDTICTHRVHVGPDQNRRGFRNRTIPLSSNLESAGIFLFSSNVPIRRYAGHLEIRCTSLAVGDAICLDRIISARKEA